MKPTLKSLLASLMLAALSATSADAAVIVTLPTPSLAGSIVITQDINFTITTAGGVRYVAFDEWVTSDGTFDIFSSASISPSLLSYSLNGGATATVGFSAFVDNLGPGSAGDITPNDGLFELGAGVSTILNDVFTP